MPRINVNVPGAEPLFDIGSDGRRGPGRRDRLSPADIARISRTVHRAPEAMVKVLTKGGTDGASVARHVGYITRHGALPLETDEGERRQDPSLGDELLEQWDLDLQEHRRSERLIASQGRKPAKLVHKLMLSMPAGTPPQSFARAASHFLREEFAVKHRYAFVLHTDQPHPHVHALVKAVSEHGERLRIDRRTLRRWRERFAEHLRAEGIEANATIRAVRGQPRNTKHDGIFRAARRGESTHINLRVRTVINELSRSKLPSEPGKARLLSTRHQVETGWLALSRLLLEEGKPALAAEVRRFVQRMPPASTDRERLVHELRSRALAIHRERDPPTR